MNRPGLIYLDHAAATPLDPKVLEAMRPYLSERFFNPTSPYKQAVDVRRDYEEARARVARIIGGKPGEVIFTAGATESINLAFESILADGGSSLVPSIEHHAVLAAAARHPFHVIVPTALGEIEPSSIEALILPDTRLVSVALANNELGTIQPIREIADIVSAERTRRLQAGDTTPLYLHTDASQAAGLLDVHLSRLGVDLMTLNGGKMYGMKQTGILWASASVPLRPQIVGGGQERGVRSGTENVAGMIGFASALELAEAKRKAEVKRLASIRDELQRRIQEATPDVVVTRAPRTLANFLHLAWPGLDAERVLFRLEADDVLIATGSACAANSGTRSHCLVAIGMNAELADGSLRISLGRLTREEDTKRTADLIIAAVNRERA